MDNMSLGMIDHTITDLEKVTQEMIARSKLRMKKLREDTARQIQELRNRRTVPQLHTEEKQNEDLQE